MNTSFLHVHLECSLPSDAYQKVKVCFIIVFYLFKLSYFKPSLEEYFPEF